MPHELPKAYEPGAIEARWAEYWVKEKLFSVRTPPEGETRPVFTLLLPPPNVTGRLHMGHMLNQTQMDILCAGIACVASSPCGCRGRTMPASPRR